MSGSYRGGFEQSSLSGPGCRGRVRVSSSDAKDAGLDEAMKKMRAAGRGLGGIPVGELEVTKVVRVGKDGSDR